MSRLSLATSVALLVILVGIFTPQVTLSARQTVTVPTSISIVDSRGQVVAHSAGNGYPFLIGALFEIDGKMYALSSGPTGFSLGTFYYQLPNCQGQAYIPVDPSPGWWAFSEVGLPGRTLYEAGAPQTITRVSRSERGSCFTAGGTTALMGAALPVIDLDTIFTPPFRLVPGPGLLPPGGCTTPDPFVALGGGVCVNGGWQPPSAPPPPPPSGCTTPDPFVALGGGVCVNGGWQPKP